MTTIDIAPRPRGLPADLGAPVLPGSKSHTQRAMLLAAASGGRVRLQGALHAIDTDVLGIALESLGARVRADGDGFSIDGSWAPGTGADEVTMWENGTGLRMLLVVVPMLGGWLRVDGAERLRARPIDAVLELLAQGGVRVDGARLPLSVDGRRARWPQQLTVDAANTSQPASGALLGLALRCRRLGAPPSMLIVRRPAAGGYLQVTIEVLRQFGFAVDSDTIGDDVHVRIADGAGTTPATYCVPPDASAMAFPMALAALHGLPLPGLDGGASHPDARAADEWSRLITAAPGVAVALDRIASHPDSFPALAVAATGRRGETRLGPAPALRHKECDRIAAMAAGLAAAGVDSQELRDGLVVRGPLVARAVRSELPAPADHRIVMALALLGTRTPIRLPHADCVAKSWPAFWEWLARVAELTSATS